MCQKIIVGENTYKKTSEILKEFCSKKFMLVCDSAFGFLPIGNFFDSLNIECVKFDSFTPNPLYEDVCSGIKLFNESGCDTIVAVGGGSTIDVAKCIKLFSKMNEGDLYINQEFKDSKIPLVGIPTTAGTGSESTRHAVIYYNNSKQSISHASIVPDFAILDSSLLKTLPRYQKICTMLDALCQAIESWWSVNSNEESISYSKKAIDLIIKNKDAYIEGNLSEAAENIILGANYAGRAINITATTAAHAMSYKLTSMYGLPHGHAVAVCLPCVWRFMLDNEKNCIDKRGYGYVRSVFEDISKKLFNTSTEKAIEKFDAMIDMFGINRPISENRENDISMLVDSVNVARLSNNPITPSKESLKNMYEEIVK